MQNQPQYGAPPQQQQYPPQQQQQQYQPQQQQQYPPQQQQQQQYPPQQQQQNQPQQQQQQQPQVQLFQVSGAAEVYVEDVFQGVRLRRHIDSGDEFNRRGYDWGKIRQVSFEELAKVPQGPSLLAPGVRALPNHGGKFKSLFYQSSNGAVLVLLDGLLRHIPHPDAYNLLFEFGINGTEFNQVTNQAVGAPLPNDTRIVSQNGALYLIDSQYKRPVCRHIVNPDVMSIKQFSWSRAQPVSSLPYPVGAPIGLE